MCKRAVCRGLRKHTQNESDEGEEQDASEEEDYDHYEDDGFLVNGAWRDGS